MSSAPLLRLTGVTRSYPGVRALDDVSLDVRTGEILGLVGENGAGKSTLIRILAGAHTPDSGTLELNGEIVTFPNPAAAANAGVGVIYQEFNLIPALTAVDNLFLGRETFRLRRREERRRAEQMFDRLGADIPLDVPCRSLSVAQQQLVEIARALLQEVRLLIMDEPTAALTPREVDGLMSIVRELRSEGIGIIYVSHRLDEIFDIADSATVLRDGRHIASQSISAWTRTSLIEQMVGRELTQEYPKRNVEPGDVRFSVSGIGRDDAVSDVSFFVRAGEILGITGLIGAGRTELLRLIFGADRRDSGSVELDGRPLRLRSPRDAIRAGLCLLTEDRKSEGLVLQRSVLENFSLASLPQFSRRGFIHSSRERRALQSFRNSLRIRFTGPHQRISGLSGGNQQKVLLARWLQRNARVIIFDEPTRGIDVGARHEIYQLMNDLVRDGKSIIMVTSELPEALGMSDRILVMRGGRIAGEVADVATATQESLTALAIGTRELS